MEAVVEAVVFASPTTIICLEGENAGVLCAMKKVIGGQIL
jgi:hypothetical protein